MPKMENNVLELHAGDMYAPAKVPHSHHVQRVQ
jgi:hypothetical protein